MVVSRNFLRVVLFVSYFSFTAVVSAECIPSDDPCASKKKIGEWDISGSLGLNVTDGNSNTTVLNVGPVANYQKAQNIFESSIAYNYGEDSDKDDETNGGTTKNDLRVAANYIRLMPDRFYLGLGNKLLYDEIADIDYRDNIDPAAGYYLLKDNSFQFRVEAGPSYVFEKQGGIENDYLAPRVADKFEWKITCTSKLFQAVEYLGDVDESENYLVNGEAGIESAIATNLSLVFKVVDNYDNVPAEGKERNDLQLITAIKFAL